MNAVPRRALDPRGPGGRGPAIGPGLIPAAAALGSVALVASAYLAWGPRTPVAVEPVAPPAATTTAAPSPTAAQNETGTPTPSATVTASSPALLQLDDTAITIPAGWVLYGDERIEADRRLVRLSDPATDTRYQAVSLIEIQDDLGAACRSLVASQGGAYEVESEQLVAPAGVETALGEGVSCGFSGLRSSDRVPNAVTFFLIRRVSDGHVLMLRLTVPDAVQAGSPARVALTRLNCEASSGFGVSLPLC